MRDLEESALVFDVKYYFNNLVVIVSLMEILKRLNGFMDLNADLFVLSNLKYDRLFTEKTQLW